MPVPIIMYYDKAALPQTGDLAMAPIFFTYGFFRSSWQQKSFIWRIPGYIPNLSVGTGRSDTKYANEKEREHHLCLVALMREFKDICNAGGFIMRIGNREVVLKFFIQYIVVDTVGHNVLCCHYQKRRMP